MRRRSAVDCIVDLEMHGIKLGLEKIRLLLGEMGNPERRYPCVLVAGTNGKGSVTAMMAEALKRAGFRCGRYTSPHLVSLEERICLNDRPIPPSALERGAARARAAIERLIVSRRFEAPCTFFEATTAMALDYFARSGVDAAILEVGMGGRFDATNAVEPIVSVITNIELDHERYLGSTRRAIAREKVGIARAGRTLIAGPTVEESLSAIRAGCEKAGARFSDATRGVRAQRLDGPAPVLDPAPGAPAPAGAASLPGFARGAAGSGAFHLRGAGDVSASGEWIVFHSERRTYGPLRLALAGRHQIDNALTAVAALEQMEDFGFRLGAQAIEAGLSGVRWPGRLDHLPGRPLVILDGAHNPAGARALASYLAEREFPDLTLVFGAMGDKSILRMAETLFPLARRVVLTRTPYRRAANPQDLRLLLAPLNPSLRVVVDPGRALESALALTPPGGTVCVCGSLYLVGSVLGHPALRERRLRERRRRMRAAQRLAATAAAATAAP